MPTWTYKCPNPACGLSRDASFHTVQQRDHTVVVCRVCCVKMERQPSAPSFTVGGFSAANGYSKETK